MKRIWIGIGLLVILLGAGLWAMFAMNRVHTTVSLRLRQAAQTEDWEQAQGLALEAEKQWKHRWLLSATLADHTDIDGIEALFAELEVYRQQHNASAHAATCARLAEKVTALADNHRLSWWNLL